MMRTVIPPPWLTYFQLRNAFSAASAATQVAIAKYMPFIRKRMTVIIDATTALTATPSSSPREKGRFHSEVTMVRL